MNLITSKKFVAVLSLACLVLSSGTWVKFAYAQDDSGYSEAVDYSGGYSEPTDYSNYSEPTSSYSDYSEPVSYSESADYSEPVSYSDYSEPVDYSEPTDYSEPVDYSEPIYSSNDYGYSSGYGYSTPTYYSSTPSYSSYAYSTPGLGSGYSSNIYTTPGTGYSTSGKTQTPVVYNTPTQTSVAGQPIVINNNNNNTNTNTNNNSAPVTQVVNTQPQHIVDYVYPTTPTYTTYRTPIVAAAMPAVSLSQIPYTGFDFGPVGDAIYWMGLLAFAVAAAYLLVYYRGGAFALASALIGGRSNIQPVQFTEADTETEIVTEAPVVEKVPVTNTRIASVISNLPTAAERHVTSDAMIVSHSKNGEVPRIVITRE